MAPVNGFAVNLCPHQTLPPTPPPTFPRQPLIDFRLMNGLMISANDADAAS